MSDCKFPITEDYLALKDSFIWSHQFNKYVENRFGSTRDAKEFGKCDMGGWCGTCMYKVEPQQSKNPDDECNWIPCCTHLNWMSILRRTK